MPTRSIIPSVAGGGGDEGVDFNIHCQLEEPTEDKVGLWIMKELTPAKVKISNEGLVPKSSVNNTFTATMPTARESLASIEFNGKIYCIGGLESGYTPSVAVEVYDPVADEWETKNDFPEGAHSIIGHVLNNKLYVFIFQAVANTIAVYEYDATTDGWTEKADPGMSPGFLSGVSVGSSAYVFCCMGEGEGEGDFKRYDAVTNTWTELTTLPSSTMGGTFNHVNGVLYYIGGMIYMGGSPVAQKSVYTYNIVEDEWSSEEDLHTAPEGMPAPSGVLNGLIYILDETDGKLMVYDPTDQTYVESGSSISTNRTYLSGVIFGNDFYVFGGSGDSGSLDVGEVIPLDKREDIEDHVIIDNQSLSKIAQLINNSTFVLNSPIKEVGIGESSGLIKKVSCKYYDDEWKWVHSTRKYTIEQKSTFTNIEAASRFNFVCQIDDTHFILAYTAGDYSGYVKTFEINSDLSITEIDSHQFELMAISSCVVMIDSTHFIIAYETDEEVPGRVKTFSIDSSCDNITEIDSLSYSSGMEVGLSIAKLDDTHFVLASADSFNKGEIRILSIDSNYDNITILDTLANNEVAVSNSLVILDATHFALAYTGTNGDCYVGTFELDESYQITRIDFLKHASGTSFSVKYNSLVKVDSTHLMVAYEGADGGGFVSTLSIDEDRNNITLVQAVEHDEGGGTFNSLAAIDEKFFVLTYSGGEMHQYIKTFSVNDDCEMTELHSMQSDISGGYNSLCMIDDLHFVLGYTNMTLGIIKVFELD